MAKFSAPTADQYITLLVFGIAILVALSYFIDFSALTSEDEGAEIFKNLDDPASVASPVFTIVIVGAAVMLSWYLVRMTVSGALTKASLITYIVLGVGLYLMWTYILVPNIDGLKPIEASAYALQSMVSP